MSPLTLQDIAAEFGTVLRNVPEDPKRVDVVGRDEPSIVIRYCRTLMALYPYRGYPEVCKEMRQLITWLNGDRKGTAHNRKKGN